MVGIIVLMLTESSGVTKYLASLDIGLTSHCVSYITGTDLLPQSCRYRGLQEPEPQIRQRRGIELN